MREIRAALCRAYDAPLTIETLHLAPPREGEVTVEIDAVAICHSDIAHARGAWPGPLPAVQGHEAVGRVSAAGEGADLAAGEVVLVTLIRACGRCVTCRSGRPTQCPTPPAPPGHPLSLPGGTSVTQAMHCGAFAEAATVHASQCVAVPGDIPRAAAACLSCGVVTGVGAAVHAARVRPGQDVVVIGAGGVGLNAVQGAHLAGARRILAVDIAEERVAAAREFGATDTVAGGPAPWEEAARILGRGADAVLVCTGAPPAYADAPRYLAGDGTVVAVGMPPSGVAVPYEPLDLAFHAHDIRGSRMGEVVLARDIPWMVDLWRQGRLKLEELVSRTWALDDVNEAIADTAAGAARRNVIVFG